MKRIIVKSLRMSLILVVVGMIGSQVPVSADDNKVQERIKHIDSVIAKGPFAADWQSLKAHQDADWFRDAKFGIYTHWGPVTVGCENCPTDAEWYGLQMYDSKHPAFQYHLKTFGDQKTVGFKDVIPRFKAEKFDADAWADLFAKSGAKFAGPVAVHHDNFANWDSEVTRWNSRQMGPKRDITGELEKAIRKKGMRFFASFHHGFSWQYYENAFKYDAADPQWADLYSEPHKPKAPPTQRYLDQWLAMVDEVVEKYQPDLIWFDFELGTVIPDLSRRQMFAAVYDWAAQNGRQISVAHKFPEMQQYTGILDYERGREDRLAPYPWLTDTSLGPWFHHECLPYRSLDEQIDIFVDIVSKNGCLLLNVGPRSDGTFTDKAKEMLLGMGKWLAVNGEAIYSTRPWSIFGEGPTHTRGGVFSEQREKAFTAKDIRFTTKNGNLYAIALAWPEDGKLLVRSLAADAGKVTSVSLLGHEGKLQWSQTDKGLSVEMPVEKPCDCAFALKICGENLKPSPTAVDMQAVQPAADGSLTLSPDTAELHGEKIRIEEQQGHEYIAAWDRPDEWVSWKAYFPAPGTYRIVMRYSAAYADTQCAIDLAGKKIDADAKKTSSWFDYGTLSLGSIMVDKAGVAELSVRAKSPDRWRAMNIRDIKLEKSN